MKRDPIKKSQKINISIGFLGGGQLARMLALAAHPMGLIPKALVSGQNDPACPVVEKFVVGDSSSETDVRQFCKDLQLVTFESEFVNANLLAQLEKQSDLYIFPKPSVMKELQNRISQKTLLDQFKINTAPWTSISQPKDLDLSWQQFKGTFVLKSSFGGYDGNGTFIVKKQSDLGRLAEKVANDSQEFLAEKFIPFKRELACIYVRSRDSSTTVLPLVQTLQTNQRCDWVLGPIQHPDFHKTSAKILKMMKAIDYVGALGVEFFDTGKTLLVNEMAPRVHNSGHYSQDSLSFSQFDLHLKAGLGEKLPKPELLAKSFVMTNLIGESKNPFQWPNSLTGQLHWYGKKENRPGRKMGHINYLGLSAKSTLLKALSERKKILK